MTTEEHFLYERRLELHPDYCKELYKRRLELHPNHSKEHLEYCLDHYKDFYKNRYKRSLELYPDYNKINYKRKIELHGRKKHNEYCNKRMKAYRLRKRIFNWGKKLNDRKEE